MKELQVGDLCEIVKGRAWTPKDERRGHAKFLGRTVVLISQHGWNPRARDMFWNTTAFGKDDKGVFDIVAASCLRRIDPDGTADGLFNERGVLA